VIEVFTVSEKLTSILSVERLAAQRRRRIGRALLDLHGTLETVLANAQHILARKPDEFGTVSTEIEFVEAQVRALEEAKRLLTMAPLNGVLRIKWEPFPRFLEITGGKGQTLILALAAFYQVRPTQIAEAEVTNQIVKENERLGLEDEGAALDAGMRYVSFAAGLREARDGEQVLICATPQHYRAAQARVAELRKLTDKLRRYIAQEFKPEELA
jgi:hypothetical protein